MDMRTPEQAARPVPDGTEPENQARERVLDPHSPWAKLLCLLFALLLLLALEGISRLLYRADNLDEILAFLRQDAELFWRQRSKTRTRFQEVEVITDRLGFRNHRLPLSKNDGAYRIVCLGASPTFGWGVDYEDIYSVQLGKRLTREYGATVEVFNGAVIGYSSHQGLRLLDKYIVQLEPDLITVSYVLNDLDRYRFFRSTGTPDRDLKPQNPVITAARNVLFRSAFLRLVEKLSFRMSARNVGFDKFKTNIYYPGTRRVPPEHYTDNLNRIIDAARAQNIDVVLIKMPVNLPLPDNIPKAAEAAAGKLLDEGLELAKNSQFQPALEKLQRSAELNQYLSETYYWMGVCRQKTGHMNHALRLFQQAKDMEAYRCGRDGRLYNQLMEQVAGEQNLPLVDVVAAFEEVRDAYLFVDPEADPIHPNARGHRIIADMLYRRLHSMQALP